MPVNVVTRKLTDKTGKARERVIRTNGIKLRDEGKFLNKFA